MNWEVSLGGFVVGLLVGLTGMGGALVMTPMMIFLFGVNPTVAVGTDLIYSSITKIFGAWQHWRQKTVDWVAVRLLTMGSVPGALAGAVTMLLLQKGFADSVQGIVGKLLGITYLLISLFMIWQVIRAVRQRQRRRIELETAAASEIATVDVIRPDARKMIWLGIIAGYVVGLTSVGSGTLFMAFLVVIYPIAVARLVGTDIVQAVLVTGVAGLAHLSMGNVDLTLVGQLLIGSIPGILIGSRMTTKVPESFVKSALFVLILCAGYKMLMK
ncbi:sulfite exporter TauE/SafE family protein [Tumebacillus sp. ITR2]|uniref:Probable membrane transporter protein n=1 Tax=Tumebacillus amylolyticus TaxID=2801339 RepID=A0ABS1J5L9_9BACL|nr:sulfite exporter TauE/SafE family protein [Tumebacillus amylolyticus]MBL0385541.1 sulfite exporter TauE/SafE family protein [Tumebacillus amylolyticus]